MAGDLSTTISYEIYGPQSNDPIHSFGSRTVAEREKGEKEWVVEVKTTCRTLGFKWEREYPRDKPASDRWVLKDGGLAVAHVAQLELGTGTQWQWWLKITSVTYAHDLETAKRKAEEAVRWRWS